MDLERQITKYINECRNRETNCDGMRSTAKYKVTRTGVPPEVPPPDYAGSVSDNECGDEDEGWDTDFDDDLEEEEDGHTEDSQIHVPQTTNLENSISSQKKSQIEAMIQKFNLGAMPVTNNKLSNSVKSDNSSSSTSRAESTPNGRPDLSKRSPLPRPPNLPLVTQKNNSRPLSMVNRPLHHPPPPPVIPKPPQTLPQELTQEGDIDNYETPAPSLSDAGSRLGSVDLPINTSLISLHMSGGSVSPASNEFLSQSRQDLNCESPSDEYEIPDGNSESQWSSSSGVSVRSTGSDRPALPPKRLPADSLVPPPLPQKPKARIPGSGPTTPQKEAPLLPTRSSGDGTNKTRKRTGIDTLSNLIANIGGRKQPNKKNVDSTTSARDCITLQTQARKLTKSHSMTSLVRNGNGDSSAGSPSSRPLPAIPCNDRISRTDLRVSLPTATSPAPIQLLSNPLENQPWFHKVEREDAEILLKSFAQSGSYLVRESKRAGQLNPYTLTIFYDNKISHLNIRQREDGQFALGKEKEKEKTFSSVEELVIYHQTEPILLRTGKGEPRGSTCLRVHPEKNNF